ncbi:MAG: type III pantothenate kinase [Clostridiales bacterium]|nr:type III pantothenate kinase [Clostridiales bacterium]
MILTVDIGNTNITLGAYEGKELLFESRMETNHSRMEDQYAIELRDILDLYGIQARELEGAIVCSVVPALTRIFEGAIRKLSGTVPLVVGPGIKTGLNILIDNPAQLGADMVAGAIAAIDAYPCPCVIFDMGTATTAAVVDRNHAFLGGLIIPGIGISLGALASRTAQLPQISLEAPSSVIGRNTIDCMQAGSIYGAAAMIDGICDRVEDELGEPVTVVATGGLSTVVVPFCRREVVHCDNLILEGLRILFEKNRPAK